jgi:hypothetical protein
MRSPKFYGFDVSRSHKKKITSCNTRAGSSHPHPPNVKKKKKKEKKKEKKKKKRE